MLNLGAIQASKPVRVFGRSFTQKKGFLGSTHRTRSPAETVQEYSRFMSRMGITRLANVTGLDCIGLPIYIAVRPNSRALSTAQGKGLDADSAKASALMEAIEGWHGERVDLPLRYESYRDLCRHVEVVDVTAVSRTAGTELRLDAQMLWVEGWDLLKDAPVWVPYDTVTTNFVRADVQPYPILVSTNGLASGNHLLEAISHGLCEVLERDALALWTLSDEVSRKRCQLDLTTVNDPGCVKMLAMLSAAGVYVAAWDITSDSGIPAYTCTILDSSAQAQWRTLGSFSGHGCHLQPGIALMRALSEAIQSRLTIISGSRDDMFLRDYVNISNEDDRRSTLALYRTPPAALSFQQRLSLAADDFETDIATLLSALRSMQLSSAVLVDLGKPDVGIPVVKVVVPGLEGNVTAVYQPGKRARARLARFA